MYPVMKDLDVEVIFSALFSRQNTCEVQFQTHLVRRLPTSFPGALSAEAVPSARVLRLSHAKFGLASEINRLIFLR